MCLSLFRGNRVMLISIFPETKRLWGYVGIQYVGMGPMGEPWTTPTDPTDLLKVWCTSTWALGSLQESTWVGSTLKAFGWWAYKVGIEAQRHFDFLHFKGKPWEAYRVETCWNPDYSNWIFGSFLIFDIFADGLMMFDCWCKDCVSRLFVVQMFWCWRLFDLNPT